MQAVFAALVGVAWSPGTPDHAVALARLRTNAQVRRSVLRIGMSMTEPKDASQCEALIAQTSTSKALVVLHFCQSPAFSLTATVVQKTAEKYHLSQLYGGVPVVGLQVDVDKPGMADICAQYEVSAFPTLQIWHNGACKEVAAAELEAALVALGAKPSGQMLDTTNFGGTATFGATGQV